MSAAQLVVDDGVCVTRRGRVLARHVACRAAKRYFVGEDTLSRASPALAPVAAQDLAGAIVAVESEPERRQVLPCAPVAAQDLVGAIVAVESEPEPRPVRPCASMVARDFAGAIVAVESEPEPRPVRPPAPVVVRDLAGAVVAVVPEPEPKPKPRYVVLSLLDSIDKSLKVLRKRKDEHQQDLEAARKWLTRKVGPSRRGISLPDAADSIARQRLTADVSLSEFHPERHSKRPNLSGAISALEPCAAPGCPDDTFGRIPDSWNTGACRTRAGAEQAAKVLDEAIDGIAREHYDGHTDPRDCRPGGLGRSIEDANEAALGAWQDIRERVIECMISAAEEPEALEIRRRRESEQDRIAYQKTLERKRLAREPRARRATASGGRKAQSRRSPKSPKSDDGHDFR